MRNKPPNINIPYRYANSRVPGIEQRHNAHVVSPQWSYYFGVVYITAIHMSMA